MAAAQKKRSPRSTLMGVVATSLVGLAVTVVTGVSPIRAASPGDFDLSFSTDGWTLTDFGGGGQIDNAFAVARQADGRLVVAGLMFRGNERDVAVARYDANGALDTTFDTDGKVTTDFHLNDSDDDDYGQAVAIQQDGMIVVAGYTNDGSSGAPSDFAIARYDANGALDTTFDTDGKVMTDFGGDDKAFAVAIQPDGKIVVAGLAHNGNNTDFAIARYDANGALDTTFDTDGKVTTELVTNTADQARAIAIQPDGKILAVGITGAPTDFAVARYDANGALDTTFGTGGKVTTNFLAVDMATSVALNSDGTILVGGSSRAGGSTEDWAVARYTSTGALDNSFGTGGKVTTDFVGNMDMLYGIGVQSDGRIVAAGWSRSTTGGTNDDCAVARFTTSGALDISFGTGGKVRVDPLSQTVEGCFAMTVQPDDTVVVAGFSQAAQSTTNDDFFIARFNTAEPPTSLSYSVNSIDFQVGSAITPLTPSVTGSATSWSVSPTLPIGLVFNSSTGVISGTPTQPTASASYAITATNVAGSAVFNLTIAVTAPPPAPIVVPPPVIIAPPSTTVPRPSVPAAPVVVPTEPVLPGVANSRRSDGAGVEARVEIQVVDNVSTITIRNDDGSEITVTHQPTLIRTNFSVYQGSSLVISGDGYQPATDLSVWMNSTPTYLGTTTTTSEGTFEFTVMVPADFEIGDHALQVEGTVLDDVVQSTFLGLLVLERQGFRLPDTGGDPVTPLALALIGTGLVAVFVATRRRMFAGEPR